MVTTPVHTHFWVHTPVMFLRSGEVLIECYRCHETKRVPFRDQDKHLDAWDPPTT